MDFNACLARKLKTGTGLINMLEETFADPTSEEEGGREDYDEKAGKNTQDTNTSQSCQSTYSHCSLTSAEDDDNALAPTPDPSGIFTRHLTSKKPVSNDTRSTFRKYAKHIEQDDKR